MKKVIVVHRTKFGIIWRENFFLFLNSCFLHYFSLFFFFHLQNFVIQVMFLVFHDSVCEIINHDIYDKNMLNERKILHMELFKLY